MPRSVSVSLEEHKPSNSLSFSSSSIPLTQDPQWPPSPPMTPEYRGPQRKRIRTASPSTPESYMDIDSSSVVYNQLRTNESLHILRTPSPPPKARTVSEGSFYLPTPPRSQDGDDTECLPDVLYPLRSRPLSRCGLTPLPGKGRSSDSSRRIHTIATPQSTSSASLDRFISSRNTTQNSASSFRLGKLPHLLSEAEKLLRRDSATQDPFVSGNPRCYRSSRSSITRSFTRSASRSGSRSVSNPDVLTIPHPTIPSPQYRRASAGAVWNIGGGSTYPKGPIKGISNGRGGLIGSGTNAPLYTAQFLEPDTPEECIDTYENRLAAALDIDRTRRTLDFTRPRYRGRQVSGTKRKRPDFVARTQWKYGEWTREGDISRECRPI